MDTKKIVKKNLISNVSLFVLNGVIGFWLPPYMIKQMGAGAYGLIPLATSIIGYVAFITVAINGSLSRFMALEIANKNNDKASSTFNTALSSLGIMLLVLCPFLIYFALNITQFISVPTNLGTDASFLFICVIISFILTTFTSVFNTSAYLANRLDLINQVSLISIFTRVLIIIGFFFLIEVSLRGYGIAVLVASILSSAYSFQLFKKFTPFIRIQPSRFDKSILKDMYSMGWWLMVVQLGSILFLQIDLLVINKLLGADAAGEYGALLQWSNMIRTFAITLAGVTGPMILNYYATGEKEKMLKVTKFSNKLLSLLIACAVGVLCIISSDLLSLWLGEKFRTFNLLFVLMLIHLPINLGVLPLFNVNRAYNKVKVVGIFTCVSGVLNLLLAIALVKYTDLGVMGVAIASGIILTIKNFIFLPFYVARNIGTDAISFFKASGSSLVVLAIAFGLGKLYSSVVDYSNWLLLICTAGVAFLILAGISYLLLDHSEKKQFIDILSRKKSSATKKQTIRNEQDIL